MAQKIETPRILQRAPEEKMTFKELSKWYLGLEKVMSLRYFPTLTINLTSFNQELGDIIVGQIKPADLENFQAKHKREGYSDAYVDRQIEAARAMINKAFDNDKVSGETVKVFRRVRKMLKRGAKPGTGYFRRTSSKGLWTIYHATREMFLRPLSTQG